MLEGLRDPIAVETCSFRRDPERDRPEFLADVRRTSDNNLLLAAHDAERAVELEQVTQGRLLLPPRIEEEVWAGDDDVGAVLVTAIVLNFEGFLTEALMML